MCRYRDFSDVDTLAPEPHRFPVQVAFIEKFVSSQSGMNGRVVAVFFDEDGHRAVDVEVGGHGSCGLHAMAFKADHREASG